MPAVSQLEAILKQADLLLQKSEDRVVRKIETSLRARLRELEARLRRLQVQELTGITDTSKREARARMLVTQLESALGAFALGDPATGVTDALRAEIIESQRIGIETASKLLGKFDDSLDLRASVDLDAVRAATENTRARLKNYDDEFAGAAEDLVIRSLVDGSGPRKAAAGLRDLTGQELWKAERISRTETIRSQDEASRATYKRNSVDLVQVNSALDDRLCGWCANRSMQVFKIEDCPIPIHPQCRCQALPWRQEWLDEGLVSLEDIQNSRATALARTKDQLRTGPSPAEKFDGKPAAVPVWKVPAGGTATPQTDKEREREAKRAERREASRDEDRARRIRLGQDVGPAPKPKQGGTRQQPERPQQPDEGPVTIQPDTRKAGFAIPKGSIVDRFPGKFDVQDPTDGFNKLQISRLSKIPDSVMQRVADAGLDKVYIGNAGVPKLDDMGHLAGVQPRGWPTGSTWDDIAGCYSTGSKAVIVGNGNGSSSTHALHEFGHSVGGLLGFDNHPTVIDLHVQLFDSLEPYFKQDGPGGIAGRQEMFAQAFAEVLEDRPRAVRSFGEDMVRFIESEVLGR